MSDDSNRCFLARIRIIIGGEEPSAHSLYKLLKLASPLLTKNEITEESSRNGAISKLMFDINEDEDATEGTHELIKAVQAFYDRCCDDLNADNRATGKRKANPNSPTLSARDFPDSFHVQDKWKFLDINMIHPKLSIGVDDILLGKVVAVHCLNSRGAIAHGQIPEKGFLLGQVKHQDVETIFNQLGGGVKYLKSSDAIKEELMEHGPVVSTTFVPDRAFVSAVGWHPASSIVSAAEKKHELLIIGWERKGFVPCWLAKRPFDGVHSRPIQVAMGNFGIDTLCMAPTHSFQDIAWQSGPYFDVAHLQEGWMQWPRLTVHVNISNLKMLEESLEEKLIVAIMEEKRIVIRDKHNFAHSRRFYPKTLDWMKAKKLLSITFIRVD
jgi:hypothetical protein